MFILLLFKANTSIKINGFAASPNIILTHQRKFYNSGILQFYLLDYNFFIQCNKNKHSRLTGSEKNYIIIPVKLALDNFYFLIKC